MANPRNRTVQVDGFYHYEELLPNKLLLPYSYEKQTYLVIAKKRSHG